MFTLVGGGRIDSRGVRRNRRPGAITTLCTFSQGRVAEVRLIPVDLRYGERLTRSGIPRVASLPTARRILERLQRISEPYGTKIRIEKGEGVLVIEP